MPSELNPKTIASLGSKLDKLQDGLTTEEASVLAGLLGVAGATLTEARTGLPEGAGIEVDAPTGAVAPKISAILDDTFKTGPSIVMPGQEVMDSVGVSVACVSWTKDYSIEDISSTEVVNPQLGLKVPGLRMNTKIQR